MTQTWRPSFYHIVLIPVKSISVWIKTSLLDTSCNKQMWPGVSMVWYHYSIINSWSPAWTKYTYFLRVKFPKRCCFWKIFQFPWWRRQMETFSALLALCAGNSPVTGEFPSQRPVTWSFDVFFDLHLNKQLNKQSWGWWFETPSRSLWRHCNVDIIPTSQFLGKRAINNYSTFGPHDPEPLTNLVMTESQDTMWSQ